MKMIFKLAVLVPVLVLMVLVDIPPELPSLQVQLVPDAHAILGVRRRSFRRGVVVGAAAGAESASAASSSQTAQAQQQTAQAQQQTAQAQQRRPPPTNRYHSAP